MNTQHNKQKLEAEKEILEGELSALGRVDPRTGNWNATEPSQTAPEADPNDIADRFEDFEEKSSTIEVLEQRLADINASLAAMEKGTYGICDTCGTLIETDRLEANPAARTCKSCM